MLLVLCQYTDECIWHCECYNDATPLDFILIFLWIYFAIYMSSSRNSVRVVFLIARGWRGTSLPRVNVRKEIQRHRCWAFSEKARLLWNILWRITPKKRNTDGVEFFILYHNSYFLVLEYMVDCVEKSQHLRRWNMHFIMPFIINLAVIRHVSCDDMHVFIS